MSSNPFTDEKLRVGDIKSLTEVTAKKRQNLEPHLTRSKI